MSYVSAAPDTVAAAAADVAGIGSSLAEATAAAAASTTAVVTAAGDEVSAAIASLFSGHGQHYQALSARAAALHDQFVAALNDAAGAYAAAEAANTSPLRLADLLGSGAAAAGTGGPYASLVTNTVGNLGTIVGHWLDDPLPIAAQIITNWAGYQQTAMSSLINAGEALGAALGQLPAQLATTWADLAQGNALAASQELVTVLQGFTVAPGAALAPLLTIPVDVTQNLANAVAATVDALGPIGLAATGPVNAAILATGLTTQNVINQLNAGNLPGALVQIVDAPAQVLDAALNNSGPGGIPNYEGLLAPFRGATQTGFVDAVVNYLPRTVAYAIGALDAPITSGAA